MLQKSLLSSFLLHLIIFLSFLQPTQAEGAQKVRFRGELLTLIGTPLHIGEPIPNTLLLNSSLTPISLESLEGKVTIVSVVPSIDTPVCEKQTHLLSEGNNGLDQKVKLVTISRDLPFAQKKFKLQSKTINVTYLSDYREGEFGKMTGLLIAENRLLTRAIIILDAGGIVRYLEIVEDLGKLPNMKRAFEFARSLL